GEERGMPGERHPDVAPHPLGGQAEGANADAGPEPDGELAALADPPRNQLDDAGLDQVQREVQDRAPEHGPDEQRQDPPHGEEEQGGAQGAAPSGTDANGDEGDG